MTDFYQQAIHFTEDRTANTLSDLRPSFLLRRISKRLVRTNCWNADEYLILLNQDRAGIDALLDQLTIQLNWFYQNPITWKLFRNRAFPEIRLQKTKRNDHNASIVFDATEL